MRILFLILFIFTAQAADADFFCGSEIVQRRGDTVWMVCGLGLHPDGSQSRRAALENSYKEFQRACKISNDCRGRYFYISPKRMVCTRIGVNQQCYQLLRVEVGDKIPAPKLITVEVSDDKTNCPQRSNPLVWLIGVLVRTVATMPNNHCYSN